MPPVKPQGAFICLADVQVHVRIPFFDQQIVHAMVKNARAVAVVLKIRVDGDCLQYVLMQVIQPHQPLTFPKGGKVPIAVAFQKELGGAGDVAAKCAGIPIVRQLEGIEGQVKQFKVWHDWSAGKRPFLQGT